MLNIIKSLTRAQKNLLMISMDSILILCALLLACNVQFAPEERMLVATQYVIVLPYLISAAAGFSLWLGVCSVRLNSYDTGSIVVTAVFATMSGTVATVITEAAQLDVPVTAHIVFGLFLFVLIAISRAILLQVVLAIYRRQDSNLRVLVYGAGATGTQLVSALRSHQRIEPVAFVDDNAALHGLTMSSLQVFNAVRIKEIAAAKNIDRVLLAMPSLSLPKQRQIAQRLQAMGLEVQAVPSFAQLIGQEELIDTLEPMNPNMFLNRDEVSTTFDDARKEYTGRNILVSGAGGSIGSELCRQILAAKPRCLVLFEMCEPALFHIHMELRQVAQSTQIKIIPVLGSITDARHVRKVLADHDIQVVVHAAAYKHVPMVEHNPLSGMANNVLGTHTLALAANEAKVERFVLISSDKAVRPTNVMGATKRLAELVVQDIANRVPSKGSPIFSTVRFGNVLGSSGSVVPLFQDQLRRGGPLTVTHADVARYFMTVQEAVTLVLRAGAMATGGEVYVLDMGKPVRIEKLARQIIESAGYSVRDASNPDGDIDIVFTGLRPGEKMIEELTLNGNLVGTAHKKIFFSDEESLSEIEVASATRTLRQALAQGDEDAARAVAQRWVEGYRISPSAEVQNGTANTLAPVT